MSELTDRFNQVPGEPYGYGEDGEKFSTASEADEYMYRTFQEAKANGRASGKSVRVTNPVRADRISRAVSGEIDDALDGRYNAGMPAVQRLIDDKHITEEEADKAMSHTYVYTAWIEWKENHG